MQQNTLKIYLSKLFRRVLYTYMTTITITNNQLYFPILKGKISYSGRNNGIIKKGRIPAM